MPYHRHLQPPPPSGSPNSQPSVRWTEALLLAPMGKAWGSPSQPSVLQKQRSAGFQVCVGDVSTITTFSSWGSPLNPKTWDRGATPRSQRGLQPPHPQALTALKTSTVDKVGPGHRYCTDRQRGSLMNVGTEKTENNWESSLNVEPLSRWQAPRPNFSDAWGCSEGFWPSKAALRTQSTQRTFPGPDPSSTGSYKSCSEAGKSPQGSLEQDTRA